MENCISKISVFGVSLLFSKWIQMSGFILEEDVSVILSLLVNKYYKEMQWEEVGYVLVFAWYVNVWKRYIKGTLSQKLWI